MDLTQDFVAENGVPFRCRIVRKGMAYGRDFCLTHDKHEPLVEFYDRRYPHTTHGQFVSRYSMETLIASGADVQERGLCLQGDVPDWALDPVTMTVVLRFIRHFLAEATK